MGMGSGWLLFVRGSLEAEKGPRAGGWPGDWLVNGVTSFLVCGLNTPPFRTAITLVDKLESFSAEDMRFAQVGAPRSSGWLSQARASGCHISRTMHSSFLLNLLLTESANSMNKATPSMM